MKKSLHVLIIRAEILEYLDGFFSNVEADFYPALEYLELKADQYYKQKRCLGVFNNEKNKITFTSVKIKQRCTSIIQNNQFIKDFLSNILQLRVTHYHQVSLPAEPFKDLARYSTQQLEYVACLSDFNSKYHPDSDKALCKAMEYRFPKIFSRILVYVYEWDIVKVVKLGKLDKLKKLEPYVRCINLNTRENQRRPLLKNNRRLIDIAFENGNIDMVRWLISHGADPTYGHARFRMIPECFRSSKLRTNQQKVFQLNNERPTFPFMCAYHRHTELSKIIFEQHHVIIYDALAWCLYAGNDKVFNDIKKKLNNFSFDFPIRKGLFSGFTLRQISVFYSHQTIPGLRATRELAQKLRTKLLVESYPDKDKFRYSKWTLLAVLVHKGLYEVLMSYLLKDVDILKISSGKLNQDRLLTLLLEGAKYYLNIGTEERYNAHRLSPKNKLFDEYKSMFNEILGRNTNKIQKIQTFRFSDRYERKEMSLLHFVIKHHLYMLIIDYQNYFSVGNLKETSKVTLGKSNRRIIEADVNPLQYAVIVYNSGYDKETIKQIYMLYERHNLLGCMNYPISNEYKNLFQYAVEHCLNEVVKFFGRYKQCPVNEAFPDDHPDYPGWRPIHVAIDKAFSKKNYESLLSLLSERKKYQDINMTFPFPYSSDSSTYPSSMYPLSAIFHDRQDKRFQLSRVQHSFADFLNDFLYYVTEVKILGQALYYAVMGYKLDDGDSYKQYIRLLLKPAQGKAAFVVYDGKRVIDYVKKFKKELLPLFAPAIQQRCTITTSIKNNGPIAEAFTTRGAKVIERYSELDNRFSITEKSWTISLARLPKSKCYEHAFIIIEGVEYEKPVIWFIDLVYDNEKALGKRQYIKGLQGQSKIRIEPYSDGEELLYRCNRRMMDIRSGNQIYFKIWNVSTEKAMSLIQEAKVDKKKPPKFHFAGKSNITTWASSSADGHNCFSWAREKLRNLHDNRISIPEDTIDKWIASVTSRYLPSKRSSYINKYTLLAAGVVGLFAISTAVITKEMCPESVSDYCEALKPMIHFSS